MTINEFNRELGRLETHFRLNDEDRPGIVRDWFKALAHYHVDALSRACDQVIQEATDTFWPALGRITGAIRSRMSKYEQTRRACPTCNGNTWIEVMPWKSNGLLYEGFQRCPDCGVPPPDYTAPPYRQELTATEYAQYLRGEFPHLPIMVAKTHPVVAEALNTIRSISPMKPIAQSVSVEGVFTREAGEEG